MIELVLVKHFPGSDPGQILKFRSGNDTEAIFCALLSLASLLMYAQDETTKGEVFGGYQFFHANSGISGVDGFNLNGWNASASGYFSHANLSRNFAVRIGQADFLQTRVAGSGQNNLRFSTGIVLKF